MPSSLVSLENTLLPQVTYSVVMFSPARTQLESLPDKMGRERIR